MKKYERIKRIRIALKKLDCALDIVELEDSRDAKMNIPFTLAITVLCSSVLNQLFDPLINLPILALLITAIIHNRNKQNAILEDNFNNMYLYPNYIQAYENTYVRNLDENQIARAVKILKDSNLVKKDCDEVKLVNLLNNYTCRSNYVNLLYLSLWNNGKKKIMKQNDYINYDYIFDRKVAIKQDFLNKLEKIQEK